MAHEFLETAYDAARAAKVCEGCPAAIAIFGRVGTYVTVAAQREQSNPDSVAGLRYGAMLSTSKLKMLGRLIERRPCEGLSNTGQCEVESRVAALAQLFAEGDIKQANDAAARELGIPILFIE